ncbi:MAG: hypothetical protein QXF24_01830, partial [Thermoproteota archaeon]
MALRGRGGCVAFERELDEGSEIQYSSSNSFVSFQQPFKYSTILYNRFHIFISRFTSTVVEVW